MLYLNATLAFPAQNYQAVPCADILSDEGAMRRCDELEIRENAAGSWHDDAQPLGMEMQIDFVYENDPCLPERIGAVREVIAEPADEITDPRHSAPVSFTETVDRNINAALPNDNIFVWRHLLLSLPEAEFAPEL